MENLNLFCHREWWLRLKMWWFTDQICRDSKRFSKSSYSFEIHFREIMTGVILTSESHG
jgi:hypothetical protein